MADIKDNAYESAGGSISGFDTNHGNFRSNSFLKFMKLREKEFINNHRFEGDENFSRAKQRTMLKQCFRYGYAGVINTEKIVKEKLGESMVGLIDSLGVDLKKILLEKDENYVPVAVFPSVWNTQELPVKGIGNTIPIHNIGKKIYDVDSSNTAILTYDDNYLSGYWWWLLPAYLHATGETVLKKRLSLIDGKLVNNKVNNSQRNINYESIYKVDQSFVELAPSQGSITGGKSEQIDLSKMLDTKLKKLDLSNGETINDLLTFIKDNEKSAFMEMGKRVNMLESKDEKSIGLDFEAIESHWRTREKEFEDMMNIFCDNYKKVFGVTITLKTTTQETLEELRERELVKSGHKDGNDGNTNVTQGGA